MLCFALKHVKYDENQTEREFLKMFKFLEVNNLFICT